jgi:hypothetical protein
VLIRLYLSFFIKEFAMLNIAFRFFASVLVLSLFLVACDDDDSTCNACEEVVAGERKKLLPVRKKLLPVRKKLLPVRKKLLPVRKKLLPVRKKSWQVRKKSWQVRKKSWQVKKKSWQVRKKSWQVKRRCLQVKRRCLQVKRSNHRTVTDFAKDLGWSTSLPIAIAR